MSIVLHIFLEFRRIKEFIKEKYEKMVSSILNINCDSPSVLHFNEISSYLAETSKRYTTVGGEIYGLY